MTPTKKVSIWIRILLFFFSIVTLLYSSTKTKANICDWQIFPFEVDAGKQKDCRYCFRLLSFVNAFGAFFLYFCLLSSISFPFQSFTTVFALGSLEYAQLFSSEPSLSNFFSLLLSLFFDRFMQFSFILFWTFLNRGAPCIHVTWAGRQGRIRFQLSFIFISLFF